MLAALSLLTGVELLVIQHVRENIHRRLGGDGHLLQQAFQFSSHRAANRFHFVLEEIKTRDHHIQRRSAQYSIKQTKDNG